jgi:hypothetical protein
MWTWQPSEGVEWVEAVPGSEPPLMLVAAGDAKLYIFAVNQAPQRLPAFVQARAGVRPVPYAPEAVPATTTTTQPAASRQLMYCTDRLAAYALRPGQPVKLQWQAGSWREDLAEPIEGVTTPEDVFQGDPEQLPRIVDAAGTGYGLLLLRDDGLFGLLDRDDGHVRWKHQLPPTTAAELHFCCDRVALLRQEGANAAAAFVDSSAGTLTDIPIPPETPWPLWSELTKDGLLLAQPTSIMLYTAAGGRRLFETSEEAAVLARTLHVHRGNLLLFGTNDGQLHALDVSAGRELWATIDHPDRRAGWDLLRAQGDELFSGAGRLLVCRDVESGKRRARFAGRGGARLLDVRQRSEALWLVWGAAGVNGERLLLERLGWTATPTPKFEQRVFGLGQIAQLRSLVWIEDRLVVAGGDGLSVFPLR